MKFETITYEKEGPLAWITLNRPEKLNAINKTNGPIENLVQQQHARRTTLAKSSQVLRVAIIVKVHVATSKPPIPPQVGVSELSLPFLPSHFFSLQTNSTHFNRLLRTFRIAKIHAS